MNKHNKILPIIINPIPIKISVKIECDKTKFARFAFATTIILSSDTNFAMIDHNDDTNDIRG